MSSSFVFRSDRTPAGFFLTAAVLSAVLGAAAWAPRGRGAFAEAAAPRIRSLDAATVFPDSTLALIQIDGRPCLKYAKELGISRILRSPDMQEFAGPVFQMIEGGQQAALAGMDLPFDIEELVDLLLTGRTLVGVTRVETATVNKGDFQSKQTSVDLMLALNFTQGRQESMRKIVTGLE